MVKVSIKLSRKDQKALKDLTSDLKTRKILFDRISELFDKEGLIVAGFISRNMLSGQRLNRQTGNLASSIIGRSEVYNGLPSLRVGVFRGPALAYAGIHEFGGEITPKKGKALAWPVGFRGKDPRSPSDYGKGELRFIPYRRGTIAIGALYDSKQYKVLSKKEGFNLRSIEPLFVLLRKVTVTEKRYLRDGIDQYLPKLSNSIANVIAQVIAST